MIQKQIRPRRSLTRGNRLYVYDQLGFYELPSKVS
jgi:hypothetical protein